MVKRIAERELTVSPQTLEKFSALQNVGPELAATLVIKNLNQALAGAIADIVMQRANRDCVQLPSEKNRLTFNEAKIRTDKLRISRNSTEIILAMSEFHITHTDIEQALKNTLENKLGAERS